MDRLQVIEQLLAAPALIREAEGQVIREEATLAEARVRLQRREDELLLAGRIDGKNEATRAAQLREATAAERQMVERREQETRLAKRDYHQQVNAFAALRAVARLLTDADA